MENRVNVKQLTLTAMVTAMVYIAGSVIKIPSVGGFIHVGDCMVLAAAVILGPKRGAAAAGIGMFLVDALGGYIIWAPFTLVIKALMAFIAGTVIERFGTDRTMVTLAAFIAAGIFMVPAYFISGAVVAGLLTGKAAGLTGALLYASKDVIGNIIQVGTGIVIALPLCAVFQRGRQFVGI